MTRFVVDAGVLLQLADSGASVPEAHELLAPRLIRSHVVSAMHEAVHRGELPAKEALERVERTGAIRVRLLGDAVLRRNAWQIADRLGWASTYNAEYLALTKLQGDALVTLDADLARAAEGIVPTAPFESLLDPDA